MKTLSEQLADAQQAEFNAYLEHMRLDTAVTAARLEDAKALVEFLKEECSNEFEFSL